MKTHTFVVSSGALLLGAVTMSGQGAQPAQPDPAQPAVTFRTEVNYVEVDARVVDAQGKFVPDLAQRDFEVFEDGKPQKISVFSLVNIPVERTTRPLFASRPIEPDVQTNLSVNNGRVYLIVLDDQHTHVLRSSRVKRAAKQFVERYLGANDVAAIVYTSGRADASQEFTNSQRLLLNSVDKFMGRKLRSAFLSRLEEESRTRGFRDPGARIDDPEAAERGYHARNTLESIKSFAEIMAGVRGRRKALVYFSEGIDYDINDPFNNRDATTIIDTTRNVIGAATRANVSIYGVDVRGLSAGGDESIEIQSFPDDPALGLGPTGLNDEVRMGQDSLRVLSDETGGFATVNTNDIDGAFRRLVEENSAYYVLGYYPANERRDGRFRKIEVRLNKPGLSVRARRGYVAPRGRAEEPKLGGPNSATPELREAMSSPVPVSGLALAMTAAVFKGPDNKGSVVISTLIGGRDLPLAEKDGVFRNDLETVLVATDAQGKYFPGDRNTLNLTLKPDTVQRLRASGFRVISSIELPPGRYQVRSAAREANSRRSGMVFYDVEVPDFAKDLVSISSLALTSMASSMSPTARPKDPLAKLLPGPLSTYRDFAQNDELALFTEVYETGKAPAHKVEIALTMKAEGGQTVFQTREERDSSELQGNAGGYGFTAKIPLRDIAPGLYVIRVEAQSRVAERPSVGRETIVNVLPAPPGSIPPPTEKPAPPPVTPKPPAPDTKPTPPPPASERPPAPAENVAVTTVNADRMSGVDAAQQIVVRTPAEWNALWQKHAPGRSLPAVDFAKNMVLAVFLGGRPSGGYGVSITKVVIVGNELVVRWHEQKPAPGTSAAAVMTAPAHLVSVPRRDGPVRFEKVEP